MRKKLKLEELEITSFATTEGGSTLRGTLHAYEGGPKPAPPSFIGPCYPTDPNFDCTYGCSRDTGCPDNCIMISEAECI